MRAARKAPTLGLGASSRDAGWKVGTRAFSSELSAFPVPKDKRESYKRSSVC